MYLKHLFLQNFRNYSKSDFNFSQDTTLVVGPNTSGKTNLIEAIYLLSTGKSFRSEKDYQMISFDKDLARVKGKIDDIELEIVLTNEGLKKYLVNGVSKRKADFASNLPLVLFNPEDLEIIIDSPSLRRNFLDEVLEQEDRDYRFAIIAYTKALRQRNALLELARETGRQGKEKQFEYWDDLCIKNGEIVTAKREEFITFLNNADKEIFDFQVVYDKSIISPERLLQYKNAEVGAGVTLVGPHRDDFSVHMFNNQRQTTHDVKFFGSRGQQRLAILQLKLLQLEYLEKRIGQRSTFTEASADRPILLLDDIFSELDSEHIQLVLEMVDKQQTIMTATHKEFFDKKFLRGVSVIELGLNGKV
ncbi:MAG: DNA replication and repair protein RecF [Candidatus Levyibacteriota bacterium]